MPRWFSKSFSFLFWPTNLSSFWILLCLMILFRFKNAIAAIRNSYNSFCLCSLFWDYLYSNLIKLSNFLLSSNLSKSSAISTFSYTNYFSSSFLFFRFFNLELALSWSICLTNLMLFMSSSIILLISSLRPSYFSRADLSFLARRLIISAKPEPGSEDFFLSFSNYLFDNFLSGKFISPYP